MQNGHCRSRWEAANGGSLWRLELAETIGSGRDSSVVLGSQDYGSKRKDGVSPSVNKFVAWRR